MLYISRNLRVHVLLDWVETELRFAIAFGTSSLKALNELIKLLCEKEI
ncbi:MAG: hypothetical protein KME32_34765 [Mojavia pulchra JT2-VF2]|uniref:Uncharacterized protein n=1 Tax=Mojavia pulchra JT2-VF2 TaxID=287848 RepID=A0A951UJR1_9NOST|nr:hypothetical protein [Mojavia pulchra JT2-VF2]